MEIFYKRWGWIDFLSAVAESPIFIVQGSGMTGLECAKIAKGYDVLIWASKQSDFALAMEQSYKNK